MHRFLVATVIAIALAACSPGGAPANQNAAAPAPPSPVGTVQPAVHTHNIGDVESAITVTTQLDPAMPQDELDYQELETKKGELAMAKLRLREPYPEALWVVSHATSDRRGLRPGDSAFIRQFIYLGDREEPIAEQTFTWHGKPRTLLEDHDLRVDIMKHLDTIPDSVLVHSRLEIYWFPSTAPDDIDAGALGEEPRARTISNSFRITF